MSFTHARVLTTVVRTILHSFALKFLRQRLNGPRQAMLVLLASIHSGIDRIGVRPARLAVLTQMGHLLGWGADSPPSASSIARSLRKVTAAMVLVAIERGLTEVSQLFGSRALVGGRRLVAIDGVRINAQRTSALARWLGRPKQDERRRAQQPQALVVTARCVITGVTLAQEVLPHDGSERAGARAMLTRLAAMGPMILLLDRGFPARDLIGLMLDSELDFIIRMVGGRHAWPELAGAMKRSSRGGRCRMRVRDRRGHWRPADNLRVVVSDPPRRSRRRGELTPQRMILLTNLRAAQWNVQRVIALYRRRWDIETSFREDKRLLGTARSRATTKQGFTVELLALWLYRIINALITAAVEADARDQHWNDQRRRRCSTPQIIVTAWWLMEIALTRPRQAQDMVQTVLDQIRRDRDKRRPGRFFKLQCKGVEGVWKTKQHRRGG